MKAELSREDRRSFRARWLFPTNDGAPIENGTVEITDGRISAIHGHNDPCSQDLGNVAVIPGLVNAHTHLELSDLREPLGPRAPFTNWILTLVEHRQKRKTKTVELARWGYRECAQSGSTAIADIITDDASLTGLSEFGPSVAALRELIGLQPSQIDEQLAVARSFLQKGGEAPSADIVRGLSPHAPYSVHPRLYRQLVDLAAEHRAPVAVHLAETRAELELLNNRTGPFVDMLQQFGVWNEDAFSQSSRPLDFLQPLEKLDHALIVHGNYLADDEIDFIAERPNLTVVYCPRTHAYFGHDEHPWQTLLEKGASVAIGTDSRASNPDLSIWRELCFLYTRFPQVEPAMLLKLGTSAGSRALGRPEGEGELAEECPANLAVVALEGPDHSDPYRALFAAGNQITATMRYGRWFG